MNEYIQTILKQDLQTKIGKEIRYGKDCKQLSEQIKKETKRHISPSTLKRFFGIVNTSFQPSKYTLETLVNFLGFDDWTEYLNTYDHLKHQSENIATWDLLKKRMMLVTNHSLYSLKQKTSYDPEKIIIRSFVREKLEALMENGISAAMLVAPDGFGKSTSVIQFVEDYFLGGDARYKNDIVFLIDGGIFFNLYSKNPKMDLLSQLMEFKINSSLGYYFTQNPQERKGRILMIIDNVDEIFFDKDRYHKFVENLMRLVMGNDNGWYKTLLTCRPENLDAFIYQTKKNPYLKNILHDMDFEGSDLNNAVNIPLLSEEEINKLLTKHWVEDDLNSLKKKNENVYRIIRYPDILNLFVKQYKKTNEISEIAILHSYINERIYSQPYSEEKITLTDKLLELCEYGKETNSVKKDTLFSTLNNSQLAYNELISYGIIYEYSVPDGLHGNSAYIKFNHSLIFEFLLLIKWSQNRPMDVKLFYTMKEFYNNNIRLQCTLLIFFIRMLKYEKKADVIKELYTSLKTSSHSAEWEQSTCFKNISSILENASRDITDNEEDKDVA